MNLVRSIANDMTIAQRHTLFGLLSIAIVVVAFEPIRNLATLALDSRNNHLSHILLIPFITAALIYWNRKKIFRELAHSVFPAAGAFMLGSVLYYVGRIYKAELSENDYLSVVLSAVIVSWFGAFALVYGPKAFKAARFPLLFLLLAVPVPDQLFQGIVRLLQHGSASVVSFLFVVTGTPAYREDVIFVLPRLTIEVAEACSGIRSSIAIFIISLLAAHLLLRSNWKKTAFLLAVLPISLFKNAVRIVTLSLLAIHYDMRFLTGSLHQDGGVFFMLFGMGLMYPILAALIKSEGKHFSNGVRS